MKANSMTARRMALDVSIRQHCQFNTKANGNTDNETVKENGRKQNPAKTPFIEVKSPRGRRRTLFKGEWRNDQRNGKGNMIYPSGNCYEGQWKDGMKNGFGVMQW